MIVEQESVSLQTKVKYYYIDAKKWGIVWRNVTMFLLLHLGYLYGLYHVFAAKLWYSWIFGKW